MISFNEKLIEKHLGIDKILLEDKTVRELKALEKDAKMMEETEVFETNMRSKAEFTKMFSYYDLFCSLFGEEYVDRYLLRYTLYSLTSERIIHNEYHLPHSTPYIYLREEWKDVVIPPARTRTTRRLCKIILVPGTYQSLKHEPIIKNILKEKYPWTKEFKLSIYSIDKENSLFFLSTGEGSLYIPWKSFIKGDIDGIVECHKHYHKDKEFPWNNDIVKKFFEFMKGGVDMEKYAVDMSELPVTDDQIRELRKLTKEAGTEYKMPRNRQEADELIEKLAGEQ